MKIRYLILSILFGSLLVLSSCNGTQSTEVAEDSDEISETSTSDEADSIEGYNNLTYTIADSQVTINGVVDSSVTSIEVPEMIEENYVTEIDLGAFEECTNLESISLPFVGKNVEDTENAYFGYIFGSNDNDNVPASLTTAIFTGGLSLEYSAFTNCSHLISITIPDTVTTIGDFVFSNCISLTSITIPNSVTSIGDAIFSDCTGLISATLSESLTYIGNYLFTNCISLASITIPDGVTSLREGAFSDCTGLTWITIPLSLTSVGNYTFNNCTSLVSIYYFGDETSRDLIEVGDNNTLLEYVVLYYYSETEPVESGDYWHYVDGDIEIW